MTRMEIVLTIVSMIKMANSYPECHVIQLGKKYLLLLVIMSSSLLWVSLFSDEMPVINFELKSIDQFTNATLKFELKKRLPPLYLRCCCQEFPLLERCMDGKTRPSTGLWRMASC